MTKRRARTIGVVFVAAAMAVAGRSAAPADAAAGRAKAKACQTCHGLDGVGKMPTVPNIAGESELYLMKQLKAFRSGERQDPQMSIMVKPLSDDDIANLAAWYASIAFTVKVPE